MNKPYEFLKECGVFYVLTINDSFPAGRPFGAVMEHKNDLYISTGDMKAVYRQLKENPNIQIIALKPNSRSWIRITGKASECEDFSVKEKMLKCCPVLTGHFPSADAPHFAVFRVQILNTEMQ